MRSSGLIPEGLTGPDRFSTLCVVKCCVVLCCSIWQCKGQYSVIDIDIDVDVGD